MSKVVRLLREARKAGEDTGWFAGTYKLVRVGRGLYLYEPDKDDPFRFCRPNGELITLDDELLTSDLGSVPRLLWWWVSPSDIELSALIHDALYARHHEGSDRYTFREANQILYECLRTEGYRKSTCWLFRWGCNWFGHSLWQKVHP